MAQTSPAGVTTESSMFTTIVSVAAVVAIVALIYFIARGRGPATTPAEKVQPPVQKPLEQVK